MLSLVSPHRAFAETLTLEGANALKQKIESYWAERGYSVLVFAQREGFMMEARGPCHVVRSNLIDGLPPSARKKPSRETSAPARLEEVAR